MFFLQIVHRAAFLLAGAFAVCRVDAQTQPAPDSTVIYMTSPALFQLVDFEIAAAAFGRHQVIKVEVPPGPLWSQVASHLLKVTNARAPSASDSVFVFMSITDIHFASDTLVASLLKETRFLCPGERWMRTGTDYEVRAVRVKGLNDSWTQPILTPKDTWDSFGCPATR